MGSPPAGSAPQIDEDIESLLAAVQLALQTDDVPRLQALEQQLKLLQSHVQSQTETLQTEAHELRAELAKVRQSARASENLARDLEIQLSILSHRIQAGADDSGADSLLGMSDLIHRTVLDSRDEMAEALGPVMGEAIRVQIRDSRQDMVEALYPVIGESVQRSVVEAFRELQRNIDARLKAVIGPRSVWRTLGARLRGVSPAQLALRDALPFAVQSAFLIQHGSGLLLTQSHTGAQVVDSDLVSGMLTAIRDFVHDSFGQGQVDKDLDEIQYGNQRVVIQSGQVVYLAVLIQGIEPEGFRTQLHDFVSELHIRYARPLRDYTGDPATLPDVQPKLDRLVADLSGSVDQKPISLIGRRAMLGGGLIGLLLIAIACFYLQFTIALLPIAFPGPTLTPTVTFTLTPTNTFTPVATATSVPTLTREPSPTVAPTTTTVPTPTAALGVLPVTGLTSGNVWVRPQPDRNSPLTVVILKDTPVKLVSVYGPWAELEWSGELGLQRGWVPLQWVATLKSIPPDVVTPFPTPAP
jgi:hypothetical protein